MPGKKDDLASKDAVAKGQAVYDRLPTLKPDQVKAELDKTYRRKS